MRSAESGVQRLTGVALTVLLLALAGCTRIENAEAKHLKFFDFMHNSPAFDPYEGPRPAPLHALPYQSPVGVLYPPTEASVQGLDAFANGPYAHNPIPPSDTVALAHGKEMFDRYCMVCHGLEGHGDGPAVGPDKFPPVVANLTTGTALQRSDGYIFAIIRVGRGLMPAYGSRTTDRERWEIANYVRVLQHAAAAADSTGGGTGTGAGAAASGQGGQ